jgi:protein-tyrosine kinase
VSLVEQAIARAKRLTERTEAASNAKAAAPVAVPIVAAEAPKTATIGPPVHGEPKLFVDVGSLRAMGYFPEESKDRQFAEHYRHIKRAVIQKALAGNASNGGADPRLIMVTSALPGDGKTFTSVNLSMSLARERDIAVLLVDVDLAKPNITRVFGAQKMPGLIDLLTEQSLSPDDVILPTNIRGLSLLPAGSPSSGTAELLSSNRMRQLMKGLLNQHPRRLILLDSPPLLVTSEGRGLINVAGQVILVVRAGVTPKPAVQDAVALFKENQEVGIVLNEVNASAISRYYGHGYGTYGGYGYGDEQTPQT